MKAVVLVGGEGTRLRPLTETIPKPLLPLVDRPFLDHVLDHLTRFGVDEVLLSSPYLGEVFEAYVRARRGAPRVTWVTEHEPLGTGGAIANTAASLSEAFFVLNGDILTDLDLGELWAFHRANDAMATITLTHVQDARPFGLVDLDERGSVLAFREKPSELVPGFVNAGTYVLEPGAIAGVDPGRAVSVEREIFPSLIGSGAPVFGFVADAYWMDLGTPAKYLRATFEVLEGSVSGMAAAAPYVDPSADIALTAQIGRWVVAQPDVRIEDGAEVDDSVLLAGSVVRAGARVRESILGPGSVVEAGATVVGAVLAEGARVPAGSVAEGARVSAGQALEA
ncbi:MAG TPA: NDP-sugar synthase [Actinomycetota bacterium]|nr:NDP-sugar synthase [Actinomycetota bacterium]